MTRFAKQFLPGLGLVLILSASLASLRGTAVEKDFMIGVKIYEYKGDFAKLIAQWKAVGVNTAFVSADLASRREFMALSKENGIATYTILPVFQNPEILAAKPEYSAITGKGRRAEDDWVKFVCPSRDEYRNERLEYVRRLVTTCQPDGLSIDFIRSFVFWEKVYPEARPDPLEYACFCPNCLKKFQAAADLRIPPELDTVTQRAEWILRNHKQDWVSWKCSIIASMVREIAAEARKSKPGIRLNVHLVPWRENDFDQGVRTIAGQDVAAIAPFVDYLSPMCYAHMVKQNPSWISSVVRDIARRAGKPVVPSIQVKEAYLTEKLTAPEFGRYLEEVRKPPSAGVIFWNWPMLAEDQEKLKLASSLNKKS